MNIKIITRVLTLENTITDTISLGDRSREAFADLQNEIQDFLKDKANAKFEWHQSSGSAAELLFGAKAIPFTHVIVIIYW